MNFNFVLIKNPEPKFACRHTSGEKKFLQFIFSNNQIFKIVSD